MSAPDGLPLELKLGLRAGSVYYFEARELHSLEPHYFVVVNRDPLGSQLVLLTVFSSQLEKIRLRNRARPETVVEISPVEYAELKVASAVDCNDIFRRSLDEMAGLVRQRRVRYQHDLPADVLKRVRDAILASPVVDPEDKNLIA